MTTQIKNWREKKKQQRYEQEISNKLETIMYNILNDMSTSESIDMFKNVHTLFLNKIENFLS